MSAYKYLKKRPQTELSVTIFRVLSAVLLIQGRY